MKLSKKVNYLTISCGILSLGLLASCKDKNTTVSTPTQTVSAANQSNSGKIAHVNLDSLEAKYEFWTVKKAEFEKRQSGMEAEIERLGKSLQNEAAAFQKKAQAGTLSQSEGEAAQRKLGQMQQDLESKHQNMSAQLMKEQQDFNTELQKKLDDFLVKYNKDKGYSYILSYSKSGGTILLADPTLDITNEVVKGLNEESKTSTSK